MIAAIFPTVQRSIDSLLAFYKFRQIWITSKIIKGKLMSMADALLAASMGQIA